MTLRLFRVAIKDLRICEPQTGEEFDERDGVVLTSVPLELTSSLGNLCERLLSRIAQLAEPTQNSSIEELLIRS
jgi:hypothetical protein